MDKFIINIGRNIISVAVFFHGFALFSNRVTKTFFSLKLFNPAVAFVFFRQIYFTGVQILPTFIVISLIIGVGMVGSLMQAANLLGGIDQLGRLLVVISFSQTAPLVSSVILTLRSSTAVTAEIALMKMNREIETLESLSIDPYEYLYLPRIAAGIICMMALSTIFVCVALLGGYFILSFVQDMSFDYMLTTIFDNLELYDIAVFLIKVFFLGYALISIPIYTALEVKGAVTEIPVALLKGMMRLFYAFLLIQLFTIMLGL